MGLDSKATTKTGKWYAEQKVKRGAGNPAPELTLLDQPGDLEVLRSLFDSEQGFQKAKSGFSNNPWLPPPTPWPTTTTHQAPVAFSCTPVIYI
ncbi:hypothetical protein [Parahaliea mediterranea]|uniref:hypothetical protein n=1 Tax=Parahaliea mediterranea TaxID=651086 RepID=UPI0013003A46|nr:hypothetical protein [Parahaliea mediterranea]